MRASPSSRAWIAFIASALLLGFLVVTAPSAVAGRGASDPGADGQGAAHAKIDDQLERRFASAPGKAQDFWVTLRDSARLTAASRVTNWNERGSSVVTELQQTARTSQTGVVKLLKARGVAHKSFWVSNAVLVSGGTTELARALAARADVTRVLAPTTYATPAPVDTSPASPAAAGLEWGLANINADDVWASGIDGNGIVVADLDTGVDFRHPALVDRYRGNNHDGTFTHDYNWFDAAGQCAEAPCDRHGHGSHVMGTIVGDDGAGNRIGVAPGATWIAANGCDPCTSQNLLTAAQWLLAPTLSDGSSPDPSKRPNIINNSWGSMAPSTDPWFDDIAAAWDASGIFGVWANGNIGPNCATAGAPGSRTAHYSSGAYDADNVIADFSSRGAGQDGLVKPDISAPGVSIRSVDAGTTGYVNMSGTSMAAPHLSGAIALLWSASPSLVGDLATTRDLLDATARDTEDLQCGGTAADNNVFGEGRLDAQALLNNRRVGMASGTVTTETGAAIQGARVEFAGGTADAPITRTAHTGSEGTYRVGLPAGAYAVRVTAYGYVGAQAQISVAQDGTTVQDFVLVAAPMVTVSGRVSDGSGHGWPLYAELSIPGYPQNPIYTDQETGDYSVRLPASADYDVTIDPVYDGYPTTRSTLELGVSDRQFNQSMLIEAESCTAPGYGWNGLETSFTRWETVTPRDGWQVTGKGGTWRFDNPAQRPQPGADNQFAIAEPSGGKSVTTTLMSPPTDLSGQSSPQLRFDTRYLGASRQRASVEFSPDGQRWSPLWSAGTGSVFGHQSVPLPKGAASSAVQVRFTFDGRLGGYWALDNVFFGTDTCVPQEGGLLLGRVADAEGHPMPGAQIRVESDSRVHAISREFPDDLTLQGASVYWLFAPAGVTRVSAAQDGFRTTTDDITITKERLTRHDIRLEPNA